MYLSPCLTLFVKGASCCCTEANVNVYVPRNLGIQKLCTSLEIARHQLSAN